MGRRGHMPARVPRNGQSKNLNERNFGQPWVLHITCDIEDKQGKWHPHPLFKIHWRCPKQKLSWSKTKLSSQMVMKGLPQIFQFFLAELWICTHFGGGGKAFFMFPTFACLLCLDKNHGSNPIVIHIMFRYHIISHCVLRSQQLLNWDSNKENSTVWESAIPIKQFNTSDEFGDSTKWVLEWISLPSLCPQND